VTNGSGVGRAITASGGSAAVGGGNAAAARGRAKLRRAARAIAVAKQLQALAAARRALALEVCWLHSDKLLRGSVGFQARVRARCAQNIDAPPLT